MIRGGASRSRGQTPVDFVAGMGVFIVAVGFVVWFVPDLFVALDGGADTPMMADRVASQVTGPLLGEPTAGVLDTTCTIAFFTGTGGAGCGFNAGAPVADTVGVDTPYSVNVTLEQAVSGGPETQLLRADGGDIVAGNTGTLLTTGPNPPSSGGEVTVVRRPVVVDGEYAYVVVRIWS